MFRSQRAPLSNHCADSIEVGVEADDFALNRLGVGVVHRVLKRSLAIVVLVYGTARVLGFIRLPVGERRKYTVPGHVWQDKNNECQDFIFLSS